MATTQKRAETAAEFREKYGGKRFTSGTAGKAVLWSFLYTYYQYNEVKNTVPVEPLYPNIQKITEKISNVDDMNLFNAYLLFTEWQRGAFTSAILMRNGLNATISDYITPVKSLIAGEHLMDALRENPISGEAALWLEALTLNEYTSDDDGGKRIKLLRRNIYTGLRYVKAYNDFVALIAEEMKTPEITFLQVDMQGITSSLKVLNDALELLRDTVLETRTGDQGALPLVPMSSDTLRETMQLFRPIGEGLPPIPEEVVQEVKDRYGRTFKTGSLSWSSLFSYYSEDYWRGATDEG